VLLYAIPSFFLQKKEKREKRLKIKNFQGKEKVEKL